MKGYGFQSPPPLYLFLPLVKILDANSSRLNMFPISYCLNDISLFLILERFILTGVKEIYKASMVIKY